MERIKQARAGGEKRGNSKDRAARKRWILATWKVCVHGCGTILTAENVEADRKVPGGSYRRENIQGSCRTCNRARSNNLDWAGPLAAQAA